MEEKRRIDILDLFLIVAKSKKVLLFTFVAVFLLSYLAIYFFIPAQYDSTALIIPSKQDQFSGMTSLLKNISSLPIGVGDFTQSNEVDQFKTIIYSRTNLYKIIEIFDLQKDYNLKSMEKAAKILTSNITADETEDNAFFIKVRASTPEKSADITNFIIEQLNVTIINLNIKKSRDNKIFLAERYNEIKTNLENAEDSLKIFQKKSGVLEIENQTKATIDEYSKMEAELASKEIELAVMKRFLGDNSPKIISQSIAINELKNTIENLQSGRKNNSLLMPLNSLPSNALKYLRYYRNVKIYSSMLEFIIPLYEQAKFDEQKNVPILQIIDYAIPPEKKSYPSRMLYAFIISVITILLTISFIFIKELLDSTTDSKVLLIKKEFNFFKKKNKQ
jgi:capsule polysaccharide export protein KpsE/RkpR